MPKKTTANTLSPAEHGTPEPNTDAAEATVSKDAAGAESQAAPIASNRLEDTAPALPGTAGPTSLQEDTSEARTMKDEAGAESQVPAVLSNTPENNLPQIAETTSEFDVGECFEPVIPQV